MRNIYTTGNGDTLLLYSKKSSLFLHTIEQGNDTHNHSILLADDYASALCDISYDSSIYYAYVNKKGDAVIKKISSSKPLYQHSFDADNSLFQLELSCLCGKLLLISVEKKKENNFYHTTLCLPLEISTSPLISTLPDESSKLPIVRCLPCKDQTFLSVEASGQQTLYAVTPSLQCVSFIPLEEKTLAEQKAEKSIHDCEALIRQKDAIIESIKSQYETLMNTACRYRDEAAKWQNKYFSRT